MTVRFLRAAFIATAVFTAGCTESTLNADTVANAQLPASLVKELEAKGMNRTSAILGRVFKEEGKLEIWKQRTNGRYALAASYDICKISGKLGPKFTEGDRQSPEGFYTVRPGQMNPNSGFYLSFNIGYPNAYDRANGRTGTNLMVHGECSSSGCFSMNNQQMDQIYAFAREAFKGGQTEFQIQSFPFRMTAANMARYRNDPNYEFWKMLKVGYDQFEITRAPVKVDVCEKKYVFNQVTEPGVKFSPTGACPASTMPEQLASAYQDYQKKYDIAPARMSSGSIPTKASINGVTEANIVSDWTKKRATGARIPIEPPSMDSAGNVTVTSRMGRIDSPVGRKMAAIEAEQAAKEKAAEEARIAKERAAEEKRLAKLQAEQEKQAAAEAKKAAAEARRTGKTNAAAPVQQTPETAQAAPVEPQPEQKPGILGGMKKRLGSIFGS